MKLVSGIVDSGFFAQSALSAEVATKDSLGRNISETYLTGVDLTDYATTAQLDEKLDKADSGKFYPMEGNPSGFLTAHQSLQGYATEQWVEGKGYLTGVDIPESANWNATTTVVNNNSAIWNNTTNIVSANSAQWAGSTANPQIPVTGINGIKISESGDKVVFEVSADYAAAADLTGKQDLLTFGYKDTAISSIDNSALYDKSAHARINTLAGRISNKLDSSAFSDVSASFLTSVPDTYLQNTDLTITDGKVTEISGVPLSAGDELPSGVMNTSALEYNAVNEISGYNGSAIAQYGAEKQWLVHDDTLVHASNSAQYALGCNVSALQRLMSIDETVLFSSDGTPLTAFTVSEPLTNFNEVVFYIAPNTSLPAAKVSIPMVGYNISNLVLTYNSIWDGFKGGIQFSIEYNNNNMSAFTYRTGAWFGWSETAVNTGNYGIASLYKIIGIGRKQ